MSAEILDTELERSRVRHPDDPALLPSGSHIDGRALRGGVDAVADFVIVGSGASGATAAVVLAEAGYEVAVVEEGPWVRTSEFGTTMRSATMNMVRGAATNVTSGGAFILVMQGSCVGGSTAINSAIALRAPDDVIDGWKSHGLRDVISAARLAPHFDSLERDLHVHAVLPEMAGRNNEIFAHTARTLGLEPHTIRRYEIDCEGSGRCITGCTTGRKQGMHVTFIPRALRAGARIYSSIKVESVGVRGGRAVDVVGYATAEGGALPVRVRARRGVVIAASAVQTPGILRRAGLRSPALGRHFLAHPGVSIMAALDKPVHMDFGATQGCNVLLPSDRLKLETIAFPPEIACARIPGIGASFMQKFANYSHLAAWAVLVRAEAEGTVGSGLAGDSVNYQPSGKDMLGARKGMKLLAEMMFAAGAREVYPGAYGLPSVLTSPDELNVFDRSPTDPRAYNMLISHMFGAARMGADPRTSVVNTNFETHHVSGLYVVDSSLFPTNLGVNPQHTIMAVARLGAQRIADNARPVA